MTEPAKEKDRFTCPHPACGTYAVQRETGLLWQPTNTQAWIQGWAAHCCTACDEPILWRQVGEDWVMAYPRGIIGEPAEQDMPGDVRAIYEEAQAVAAVSRRSAAALLRLALQMLVDHLVPGRGDINSKIGKLVENGLRPQTQQAMDVLRVVGNNAVHPGQIDVDDDLMLLPGLFRLINVVVDQMISIPSHAQALFDSLPQQARDQVARRDSTTATN
ncbi:DUF4145 domain-containing protein [Actinoplanes sp. NPDC020271]|uniref:DUF4145 domain-containing protein n=1 Tax=Actinoplanes sp. NPDC020271 TaxID=3363896 RepID=UPI0037BD09CB